MQTIAHFLFDSLTGDIIAGFEHSVGSCTNIFVSLKTEFTSFFTMMS